MAGLLDFMTADDAQLGLGLLAAGGPSATPMSFGQRIAAGVQQAQAAKDGRLRNKLLESQIAENTSQDALRQQQLAMAKRKLDMQQGLLGYGGGAGVGPAAPGVTAPAMGAAPSAGGGPAGGMSASGGAQGGMPPPQTPVGTPRGPMTLAQISQQYKIPYESLAFDLVNNDGKGIAEMVFKRGTPDMQVSNGFAYDKNQLGAGYLPQLNISSNGQATQVQIGPDGQPVVSAPRGAVGTYGAYQGASNRSAADYQPEKVIDPATGQMVVRPRSEVLQPSAPPVLPGAPLGMRNNNPGNLRPAGASTGFQQFDTPEAGLAALDQNLQAYGKRGINTIEGVIGRWAPSNENNTGAYVSSVAKRLGIDPKAQIDLGNPYVRQALGTAIMLHENGPSILTRSAGGGSAPLIGPGAGVAPAAPAVTAGNVVELSPQQQAANDANRAAMVDRAKAGVARETAAAATGRQMSQMQEAATLANKLLDEGPTGSGVGALADRVGNFVGQPIKGAAQAAQLKALGGWLVANVPRMEGPQSDRDVANYNTMAGQVGDETLPPATRKAALQTVIALQNKYAAINGGAAPDGRNNPAPGTLPSGWTVKVK